MPIPVIPVVAGSVALLGAGALVTALVIPPLPPAQPRVWMDQPAPGSMLLAGDVQLDLHGTGQSQVSQLRIQVAQNGADIASLTDTSVDLSPDTGFVLGAGAVVWKGAGAGDYVLTPYALSDGTWLEGQPVAVSVAALEGQTVESPGEPQPEPTETTEPLPEETDEPDPGESEEPEPEPEPSNDPEPPPAPPSTPPAPPAPSGTIQRVGPSYGNSSDFFVYYQPNAAFVDVQIQVRDYGQAAVPNGTWTSYGCSAGSNSPFGWRCTISGLYTPGAHSTKWAYFRAMIQANGKTTYVYGSPGYWELPQEIG